MKIHSYKELIVWQKAMDLVVKIYELTEEFPKEEWAYLKKGIMVKSKEFGLVHHNEIDEDIELVERAKNITTQ